MKSVLISVQPKWCEKIAHIIGRKGNVPIYEKSVEIRKTKPKIETPFKCYIYETKSLKLKYVWTKKDYEGYPWFEDMDENEKTFCKLPQGRGKVIGEFICDSIITDKSYGHNVLFKTEACMSDADISAYCLNKEMYCWHISDLVIYDKPKELSDFSRHDNTYDNAFGYAFEDRNKQIPLSRPPQSWCYVKIKEEG